MKKFRNILIVWGIVTILYTVWSIFSYFRSESFLFHLSGGLFVSGILTFAIGMFSHMSATGLFDGIMYGFKRSRRAKLKEIDADYEEDEEEDPEDRQLCKQLAWNWVFVGVGSIALSFLVALI
ncbi:DUF3899 domain-containing protein [Exiguobacterium sp. B2(2022)]|uniref:DUF3899 domain-containing protein n=1 Tax=Exiguobacterium sp. B2(2022) TaxID=2992755 RepID=UPI00237B909A|nr:DUF3899 domain-containing protein [Exiguobacterium sp. B2(2022)]MDE0563874.1 DUF3899 domain-containing protein [Exiguobacterium sp. B2(2022)]